MEEQEHKHLDASQGWCCDGRTWSEHAAEGGKCCQPQGTEIGVLPPGVRRKQGRDSARSPIRVQTRPGPPRGYP